MAEFTEDWFSDASCDVLADLVIEVASVPGKIVEIGSWEGRSTVALANAARHFGRAVQAVDTWQGSPGEISADLAAGRDVFATWKSNIAEMTSGNVVAHRMGWREYVPTLDGPVALCFIDAEHTYREVFDNIVAILPYLPPGGVVCGDDQHHPPIRQALADLFDPTFIHVQASVWWWQRPFDSPGWRLPS